MKLWAKKSKAEYIENYCNPKKSLHHVHLGKKRCNSMENNIQHQT